MRYTPQDLIEARMGVGRKAGQPLIDGQYIRIVICLGTLTYAEVEYLKSQMSTSILDPIPQNERDGLVSRNPDAPLACSGYPEGAVGHQMRMGA